MHAANLLNALPAALTKLESRPLMSLQLQVEGPFLLGQGPACDRRIGAVVGGRFHSAHEGLNGRVLPGGSDWQTVMSDGTWTLDVRLVLETAGGDLIGMTYRGYRSGSPQVLEKLKNGEPVDPEEYYFRSTPYFETGSERFAWLNRIVTVAKGHRFASGPVYNVFEIR